MNTLEPLGWHTKWETITGLLQSYLLVVAGLHSDTENPDAVGSKRNAVKTIFQNSYYASMQINKFSFPNVNTQVISRQALQYFPETVKQAQSPSSESYLPSFLYCPWKCRIHIQNTTAAFWGWILMKRWSHARAYSIKVRRVQLVQSSFLIFHN